VKIALVCVLCCAALIWIWPRPIAANDREWDVCHRAQLEAQFYRLMFEEIQQSWNEQQIEKQNLLNQYQVMTNGYETRIKYQFLLGYDTGKIDEMTAIGTLLFVQ